MKHKIESIYRETCSGPQDRYLPSKLRACALPVLNRLVRLSFAFHKDVQLSLDGKPASLTNVKGMGTFPEWASISRRLAEGVFVVGDSIYTDPEDALDEYLSKCERAGKWDVRLPDGTLLPLA